MTDIYVNEWGSKKPLYVNLEYDVASATSCRIHMSASAGTYSASVSILGANVTVSACDTVFSANKAIECIFASGDFSGQADTYTAWIEATFSDARLISSTFRFKVSNPGD
jgi:hypothetical protein